MVDNFTGAGLPVIRLTTNVDLSAAEVKRIVYKKPNGVIGYWTATQDGADLIYSLQNGDIDIAGDWKMQSYVEISGEIGKGDIKRFNFKQPLI